jgi:hypothetical protein
MNTLFSTTATSIANGSGESVFPLAQRRNAVLERQISLVLRAITALKSVHTDIEALRVDGGDTFTGIGDCEFGHEEVDVTLDWPNLAIMSDNIGQLLREIDTSEQVKSWYVFHGDCTQSFFCIADDREHAIEKCRDANPNRLIHAVVPSDAFGTLVMEAYEYDPVSCPKCGSRTDFGSLPRDEWQLHVCLRDACQHSFIAVPAEEVEENDHVAQ